MTNNSNSDAIEASTPTTPEAPPADPLVIYTVSSPAGSRKTSSAIDRSIQIANNGGKVLILSPTIELLDQTSQNIRKKDSKVRVRVIHTKNPGQNSVATIMKHFQETQDGGEILIITHAAFLKLEYIQKRNIWHVICDEALQTDFFEEFRLPHNQSIITDHIKIQQISEKYSMVIPVNKTDVRALARNSLKDQVNDITKELYGKLLNPHYKLYVDTKEYENFSQDRDGHCRPHINFFGLLQPSIFAGFECITIMSACLEETILFKYWSKINVIFKPDLWIKPYFKKHENGNLLNIYYASTDLWSKSRRNKIVGADDGGNSISLLEHNVGRCEALLAGKPFVWMANVDVKDNPFKSSLNGSNQRLPNSSHGLNSYTNYHCAVVLSALLPKPPHLAFLKIFGGLSEEEVITAIYRHQVYQACGRISLRDPNSLEPKVLIVMDHSAAEWLQNLYPGSRVEQLPGDDLAPEKRKTGRPSKYGSSAEKQAEWKKEKALKLYNDLNSINGFVVSGDQCQGRLIGEAQSDCADDNSERLKSSSISSFVSPIHLSPVPHYGCLFRSKYDKYPYKKLEDISLTRLIEFLYERSKMHFLIKEDNTLISSSVYNPLASERTDRGLENVISASGIWLDNDTGDLDYKEFLKIFPKIRMVIYNTYQSTAARPRWRVFIPTSHLMSADVYKEIYTQIFSKLAKKGYHRRNYLEKHPDTKGHGFDESKMTACSLFYLPCQAQKSSDSFFHNIEEGRELLNPYEWIKTIADNPDFEIPPALTSQEEYIPGTPVDPEKISRAINIWRSAPEGSGDKEFYLFALRLKGHRVSLDEIQAILKKECFHARHPSERKDQIPRIMESIKII